MTDKTIVEQVIDDFEKALKPYTSHKKVRAVEIISLSKQYNGVWYVTLAGKVTVDLPDEMFARYTPVVGDFLVVYEDGYKSFSPRKAFLDGYKADGESFADIKRGLKIPSRPPVAGTNTGDGIALTSAAHPGDPFKGQE